MRLPRRIARAGQRDARGSAGRVPAGTLGSRIGARRGSCAIDAIAVSCVLASPSAQGRTIPMKSPRHAKTPKTRRRPSNLTLNIGAVLAGLVTFGIGAGWLIYSWMVDREAQYFAIPLVFSVPVIVAVAIRSFWD